MFLEVYLEALEGLTFGKKLPNAVYIYRYSGAKLDPELRQFITKQAQWSGVPDKFNVIKLYKDSPRLSFLYYPTFFTEAHPALHTAINTEVGKARNMAELLQMSVDNVKRWDYSKSANPPILHRKELLLPAGHPKACGWGILTAYEEEAGLYQDPAKIGNKLAWEALLKEKGLEITFQACRGLSDYDKHILRKVT